MVLLSSSLLLRIHALTLFTTSYFLLFQPSTILNSSPIWILGESMHVRPISISSTGQSKSSFEFDSSSSEILGLLSIIISSQAIYEFIFAGELSFSSSNLSSTKKGKIQKGEEWFALVKSQNRWIFFAGLRVFLAGLLVAWIYIFKKFDLQEEKEMKNKSGLDLLTNSVVFTASLTDMLFWGYLWTVMREEGREGWKIIAEQNDGLEHED